MSPFRKGKQHFQQNDPKLNVYALLTSIVKGSDLS